LEENIPNAAVTFEIVGSGCFRNTKLFFYWQVYMHKPILKFGDHLITGVHLQIMQC